MSDISVSPPYGHATFCDDIRAEIGSKYSLMGIYQGFIFLPELPIVISKFSIHIMYVEDFGIEIPPLTLQIYMPGDGDGMPEHSQEIPSPPDFAPPDELGDKPRRAVQIPVTFAPFVIKQEGQIKVRMKRGDDVVRLGMLYAKLQPGAEDSAPLE